VEAAVAGRDEPRPDDCPPDRSPQYPRQGNRRFNTAVPGTGRKPRSSKTERRRLLPANHIEPGQTAAQTASAAEQRKGGRRIRKPPPRLLRLCIKDRLL
jgi:hypothetical protein